MPRRLRAKFTLGVLANVLVGVVVLVLVGVAAAGGRQQSPVSLILGVDTGVDDAVAIVLAEALPNVRLAAITVAFGNTGLSEAYDNTLRVLNVVNRTDVPVYKGADGPMVGDRGFHGDNFDSDGFGGASWAYPVGETRTPDPKARSYLKMIELIKGEPGRHTIVMLAPLTNLAIALQMEPDILDSVEHLYILGGTLYGRGNALPSVEFNFFADPEAAKVVLRRATCPVTIVPLEVTLRAALPWDVYFSVANGTSSVQKFLRDITNYDGLQTGVQDSPGFILGDFLAVLAAAVPESVQKTVAHRVDVELTGSSTRGELLHAWEPDFLPDVKRSVTIVESFSDSVVEKYFRETFT